MHIGCKCGDAFLIIFNLAFYSSELLSILSDHLTVEMGSLFQCLDALIFFGCLSRNSCLVSTNLPNDVFQSADQIV